MKTLISLVMVLFCGCALAQGGAVKRLYVFGDSYSDTGRGWVNSNGPTAVAVLAQKLGLEFVPSNAAETKGKSLNFAVSGAATGSNPGHMVTTAFIGYGMQNQVDEFLAMLHEGRTSFDPKTAVFFVEGGLNDRNVPTEQFVADIEGLIQKLYNAGARRFRVTNLPESIASFAEVAKRLNPAIFTIREAMKAKDKDIEISVSQWGHDFDVVFENSAKYGFTDTVNQCSGRAPFGEDATPCASPDTHYFFHRAHPSAAVAKIVGQMMYEQEFGGSRK